MATKAIKAEPYEFEFDPKATALLIIDMQRDFVEPGGFGKSLGNDVSILRKTIALTKQVLEACRRLGLVIVHTREGHRPDLTDCQPSKMQRGRPTRKTGDDGPDGPAAGARRERPRHRSRGLPQRRRSRHRQAWQGAFYATTSS